MASKIMDDDGRDVMLNKLIQAYNNDVASHTNLISLLIISTKWDVKRYTFHFQ